MTAGRTSSLDAWLSFLTEPLPASESATPEAIREHAARVINERFTGAITRGLLDDRVVLAQFAQVLPENMQVDLDVPTILSRAWLEPLLRAVSHQLSHVSASRVSLFERLLRRERKDEQLGDIVVLSPAPPELQDTERFKVRAFRVPEPAPLLKRLPRADSSALRIETIDGSGRVTCMGIKSLIRESPRDLSAGAGGAIDAPAYLIELLDEEESVNRYLWNLAPLALERTGHIVIVVPRVHRGGQPLTETLGGGGCLYVVVGHLDTHLLSLLYTLAFRLSAAVVDLCSVARALNVYERPLQVFGHDVGRLFQESSLSSLVDHRDPKVRLAARRLHVAWGIAEATRVLKQDGKGLPPDWLTDGAEHTDGLAASLRNICSFYLFAEESLPAAWTIEWRLPGEAPERETVAAGRARELRAVEGGEVATKGLPALPGLKDHRATTALTFGLAELLRNARKGLAENSHVLAEVYRKKRLGEPAMTIAIAVDSQLRVAIVTIDALHVAETKVWSRTIDDIQSLERTFLGRSEQAIVSSGQFDLAGAVTEGVDRIRANWTYDFGRALAQP